MTKGLKNAAVAAGLALTGAFAAACATPVHNKVAFTCEKDSRKGTIEYTYDRNRLGAGHSVARLAFPLEDGEASPSVSMTDAENALEISDNRGWVCQDPAGKPVTGKLKF